MHSNFCLFSTEPNFFTKEAHRNLAAEFLRQQELTLQWHSLSVEDFVAQGVKEEERFFTSLAMVARLNNAEIPLETTKNRWHSYVSSPHMISFVVTDVFKCRCMSRVIIIPILKRLPLIEVQLLDITSHHPQFQRNLLETMQLWRDSKMRQVLDYECQELKETR